MKKIIYSLVILIAASSLFTSCVNYDEPRGVQTLREAKAEYLEALAGLRDADAAVQNAVAEVEKARAAEQQAKAEWQKLVNAAKEIANAEDKAKAEKAIQAAKEAMEEATLNHQYTMAAAQEAFDKLQKEIEARAFTLPEGVDAIIEAVTGNYIKAFNAYSAAIAAVEKAQQDLYDAQRGFGKDSKLTKEQYEARLNKKIERENAKIEAANKEIERITTNEDLNAWREYLAELQAELEEDSYASVQLRANLDVIRQRDYVDADWNAYYAFAEWREANPVPTVKKATFEFKDNKDLVADVQGGSQWFKDIMTKYAEKVFGKNFKWTVSGDVATAEKQLNGDPKAEGRNANYKQLGLNGIIKVIEDSKVLEADTIDVKNREEALKAAIEKIEADYATLSAGITAFVEADEDVVAAKADTTAKREDWDAAIAVAEEAETTRAEVFEEYSEKAADFTASMKALVDQIVKFRTTQIVGGYSYNPYFNHGFWFPGFGAPQESPVDFTAEFTSQKGKFYSVENLSTLLDAVKNVVDKRVAVLGDQATDSVRYKVLHGNNGGYVEEVKAIKDLTVADFQQVPVAFYVTESSTSETVDTVHFIMKNNFTFVQDNETFNRFDFGKSGDYTPFYYESQYVKLIPDDNKYDNNPGKIFSIDGNSAYNYRDVLTAQDYALLAYSLPVIGTGTLFESKADGFVKHTPGFVLEVDEASVIMAPDPVSFVFQQFGLYGEAKAILVSKPKSAPLSAAKFENEEYIKCRGSYFWESKVDNNWNNRWPAYVVNGLRGIDYTGTFLNFYVAYDKSENGWLYPLYTDGTWYESYKNFGFGEEEFVEWLFRQYKKEFDEVPDADLDKWGEWNNLGFVPTGYQVAWDAKVAADEAVEDAEKAYNKSANDLTKAENNAIKAFKEIAEDFFGDQPKGDDECATIFEDLFLGKWRRFYFNNLKESAEEVDAQLANFLTVFKYAVEKLDPYVVYTLEGKLSDEDTFEACRNILEDILAHYANLLTDLDVDVETLHHMIFGSKYGDHKHTDSEYAKVKAAEYAYNITKDRLETVGYFEAVKAWAKGLAKAIDTYDTQNNEYFAAWDEYAKALFGGKADKTNDAKVNLLLNQIGPVEEASWTDTDWFYEIVVEWAKGGILLDIYEEYFAELDEACYGIFDEIQYLDTRVLALQELIESINDDIVPAFDHEYEGNFGKRVDTIEEAVAVIVKAQEKKIKDAQKVIEDTQAALDLLAAGLDTQTINVNLAERALEAAELELAEAEEALKLAKAEYDAVIAKYVEK